VARISRDRDGPRDDVTQLAEEIIVTRGRRGRLSTQGRSIEIPCANTQGVVDTTVVACGSRGTHSRVLHGRTGNPRAGSHPGGRVTIEALGNADTTVHACESKNVWPRVYGKEKPCLQAMETGRGRQTTDRTPTAPGAIVIAGKAVADNVRQNIPR